jgi:hypothetical protein
MYGARGRYSLKVRRIEPSAQVVEQDEGLGIDKRHNPLLQGSNPCGPTIKLKPLTQQSTLSIKMSVRFYGFPLPGHYSAPSRGEIGPPRPVSLAMSPTYGGDPTPRRKLLLRKNLRTRRIGHPICGTNRPL